jgi:hypothetical protein
MRAAGDDTNLRGALRVMLIVFAKARSQPTFQRTRQAQRAPAYHELGVLSSCGVEAPAFGESQWDTAGILDHVRRFALQAQQSGRLRRLGVLTGFSESDREAQRRVEWRRKALGAAAQLHPSAVGYWERRGAIPAGVSSKSHVCKRMREAPSISAARSSPIQERMAPRQGSHCAACPAPMPEKISSRARLPSTNDYCAGLVVLGRRQNANKNVEGGTP